MCKNALAGEISFNYIAFKNTDSQTEANSFMQTFRLKKPTPIKSAPAIPWTF